MKGLKLPIKQALIELTMIRLNGKTAQAQFTCVKCYNNNMIPEHGESKSVVMCGYCDEINYLTEYEVI